MSDVTVEVWLYGALASYGREAEGRGFANLRIRLPEGSTIGDLLGHMQMHTEERGITFVNGQLSAMPGLQTDMSRVLHDDDRVGLFDKKSMWPFQYRQGAAMTDGMAHALEGTEDRRLHHTFSKG